MGRSAGVSPQAPDGQAGSGRTGADKTRSGGNERRPGCRPQASAEPIRTLIVDDHALFRRGLEMVLDSEPDIELVGEASDGEEAVSKAGESLPDVILMDIRMPRSSGIEACRALKDLVAERQDRDADDQRRGRGPVRGHQGRVPAATCSRTSRWTRSLTPSARSYGGQSLINPSMAGKLLTEFAALARRDEEEPPQQVPAPRLTDREIQVLRLVARGMNNRDIAKELFISENTVKNHVRNILEKLQIHSRMEAVMVAVREKLIEFG